MTTEVGSEVSATTSDVSTVSTPSAPASTPSVDVSSAASPTPSGDGTDAPLTPAYTPNIKFKVLDKEHEIPEFLRPVMKDAQTEKQLKELHEKAFGLDVVKPKYQETKKQLDDVKGRFEQQTQGITRLGGYIKKNDLASFFKELNISEDQVLRYALERVEYRQLPIEQRMAVDAQMQEREKLTEFESKAQDFEQSYYAESTKNRSLQLDHGLAKPEVKTTAEAFDAQVGNPGAFRDEVIKRGLLAFHTTGADISVDQAMSEVLALARAVVPAGGTPAAAAPGLAQGATPAPVQPPIIPNVAGRGASPAKRVVTSIADLRAREREIS